MRLAAVMDATWRVFTVAILALLAIGAVMLLVGKPAGAPDTGNKPGGQTVGHGAADLKATYRAIRGSNDLRA